MERAAENDIFVLELCNGIYLPLAKIAAGLIVIEPMAPAGNFRFRYTPLFILRFLSLLRTEETH